MTQFNVVCAILSTFILLVKSTMFVLHGFLPILSVAVHAIELSIYAVALSNQSTPDLSKKNVPNLQKNLPWYLSKGCSFASEKNKGYCMQARASWGVTIALVYVFCNGTAGMHGMVVNVLAASSLSPTSPPLSIRPSSLRRRKLRGRSVENRDPQRLNTY